MIVAAMTRAFLAHDLAPPPRDEILSIVGLSLPIAIARLLAGHPDREPHALVDAYKEAFFELRQSHDHHEPLFPGAREVIDELGARDDLLLGIVTGKSRRGVDAILALHGLADRFQVIRTADDAPSKPDPTMVLDAMAALGADPRLTLVVGDTTYDIEMAIAAGCRGVGVAWGYHRPAQLAAVGAEVVLSRFTDLPATVDALFAEEAKPNA
nr:HAD-IA family hydrolase [Chthonobacter albigriseus]